jgi:hypothetical protein
MKLVGVNLQIVEPPLDAFDRTGIERAERELA